MKLKEEYVLTNDNQFHVWRISTISNWRRRESSTPTIQKKEPLKISDAEALMDDLLFPHKSSLTIRLRSIQLSLKQTRILATLLPNEIINMPVLKKNNLDSYVGVLLFADVSGFTALCEKYNDGGKGGTDKLTATLNSYIGAMVEVIYSYGGDVLKFSGDAFLALWKVKTNEYVYSVIHRVLSCALYIQHTLGLYETEAKVLLRVKLGISAGNVTFSVIGDDTSKNYLIVGSPVHEVKAAEHICLSGEVILSLSAWGHLSPVNYQHMWKDEEHVQVTRIIYDPENTKREVMRLDTRGSISKIEILYRHLRAFDTFKSPAFKKKLSFSSSSFSDARSLVDENCRKNLGSDLRMFVIPPVIQQIDADLPLEYLSEMRNVTNMFVNIIPLKLQTRVLIDMVDKAYIIISDLVYKAMGSVNKVSLFDKDVMLLIIFGLRGFNHEGEVAACLQCAYDIKQACCSLDGVSTVSVGVTTGQAYCGVVGHPLRREYTVIGASVNKAARIMCAYPGKVTCDRDTFLFSNLASSYFTLQEQKALKGIESVGPIYEFTQEKRRNTWAAMHEGMYPILGRDTEMKVYQNILKKIENPNCNEKAILIRGSARIGKTRLMDEMILEAHKNGFQPIIIALHGIHSAIPYGTAQYIIKQILEIPDSANIVDKEKRLTLVLGDQIPKANLCYLNEIMNVKFPSLQQIELEDPAEKFEKIKNLFKSVLDVGTKSIIFAIDDIDFCDHLSWDLLMSAVNDKVKFLIMTMPKRPRPGITLPLTIPSELEPHVVKMTLQGLAPKYLSTLACQLLNAKAISPELESVLISRSNGNPGWCESFLVSLTQSNTIRIEELTQRHIKRLGLITPPSVLLTRTPYAVVMSPFEKVIHSKEPIEEKKEPPKKKHRRTTYPEEKKGFFDKIKAFQLPRRNAMLRDESYIHVKTRPFSIEKIQQAYEDLQQTIGRVRAQDTTAPSQVIGDFQSADEFSTERVLSVTEKFRDEDEKASLKYSGDGGILKKESKQSIVVIKPARAIASVGKICNDSELDCKLKEIFSRFPSRRRDQIPSAIRFQEPPVTKSFHENMYERRERDVSMFCKSAHAFFNSKSLHFLTSEHDLESDDIRPPFKAYLHFYSVWKPFTEDLIEESIKIFAEMKKEPDFLIRKAKKNFRKIRNTQSLNSFNSLNNAQSFNEIKNTLSAEYSDIIKNNDAYSEVVFSEKEIANRDYQLPKKSNKSLGSGKNVQIGETILVIQPSITESEKSFQERFLNSEVLDDTSSHGNLTVSEGFSRSSYSLATIHPVSDSYSYSTQFSKPSKSTIEVKRRSWISKVCSWIVRKSEESVLSDATPDLQIEDDDAELHPTILINPSVKLEEVQTPECFAGIIMSAFDCLSPYEQLMLKCASIIGERFTRKMLNALMHNPNAVLTAEGIKRLFEMRILCCGTNPAQIVQTSSNDFTPRCSCDLNYEEIVDDVLPKYAFCRVLTFKFAMFRSTLYELLPLSQKKEFHVRAVEYLESEPVICASCDRPRWVYEVKSSKDFSEDNISKVIIEESATRRSVLLSSHSKSGFKSLTTFDSEQSVVDRHVRKLRKKRAESATHFQLPSTLPDFRQCECLALQADVHQQLISHCVAAGLKQKHIGILIQYSSTMISLGNLEEASKLVREAESMCKIALKENDEKIASKRELKRFLGKTNMLCGQIHLEKGELKKANRALCMALRYFKSQTVLYPPFSIFQLWYEKARQYLHCKYPNLFTGAKKIKSQNEENSAVCYALLSNVYVLQGKWELACSVALRSLNILQKSNLNLIELCNSYSNVIDIFKHFGWLNYCKLLEVGAAAACAKLFTGKSTLEMVALGRLISSVFNARLISGNLHAAAKLGDLIFDISQRISSKKLEQYIIPQTTQLMMMLGKIRKAVSYVMDLSNRDIWYHILCLDFILDTGFSVEDGNECYDALMSALESRMEMESDVYLRVLASTCVWKLRTGKPHDVWCEKLSEIDAISPGDNFNNMVTALKILEFNVLKLVNAEGNNPGLNRKVLGVFGILEKLSKRAYVILPRFLHLKAYYYYKVNNLSKAGYLMTQARKHCITHGNLLEWAWISHNRKVWSNSNYDFDKNHWTNCARDNKHIRWTDCEDISSWRTIFYTLS